LPEQVTVLSQVGATGTIEGHKIITASMGRGEIDALSDQPWVVAISLSEKLRTLPSGQATQAAT
jgi:hypothetical protein